MKKFVIIFSLILFVGLLAQAQTPPPFKIHSNGQVSFQSSTTLDGVQITPDGRTSFEPGITTSGSYLTQMKVPSQLVKALK